MTLTDTTLPCLVCCSTPMMASLRRDTCALREMESTGHVSCGAGGMLAATGCSLFCVPFVARFFFLTARWPFLLADSGGVDGELSEMRARLSEHHFSTQ